MLKSLFSAFLMYSRIPMPKVEWREENRRYSLGFFPLVGLVTGVLLTLWYLLSDYLGINSLLFAAVSTYLPIFVTGGIHLDGYCDFTDASSSYAAKEKRLEIMSDPHIGSFAATRACLYLILQTALFSQISSLSSVICAACIFVLSRALSGILAVTQPSARSGGSLQSFVKPSHKRTVIGMEIFFITASAAGMIISAPISGTAAVIAAFITVTYCRYTALKRLGGFTGDVCGWFLQLCEIWALAGAIIAYRTAEVFS